MQKKLTGKRPRPTVRTPAEQRKHRAEQAARAILAPLRLYPLTDHQRAANWERIARCFSDLPDADAATSFAHKLGLRTVPAHLLDAAFPPAPPSPEVPA